MKNRLVKEKGSASLFVLIAILFFIMFLISMYGYVTNSEATQLEQISKIKDIYEKDVNNVDEIYDKLIAESNIIPIYNVEQLKLLASGQEVVIGEKTYILSNTANYRLMDNIEINFNELPLQYTENFTGTLDGRNNTITIKANSNVTAEDVNLFKNPNAIYKDLTIEIDIKFKFEIIPTPETAKVVISSNGEILKEGTGPQEIEVNKDTTINWEVSCDGYDSQSGTEIINDNITKQISLNETKIYYRYTLRPTPSDANVTIKQNGQVLASGTGSKTVSVEAGSTVDWEVSLKYYTGKTGSYAVNESMTMQVTLESKPVQTVTLLPSSVSGNFNESSNANKSSDINEKFAYSTTYDPFYWYMNTSSIDVDYKIVSMRVECRFGTTWAGTKADYKLIAGGTTYFETTTGALNITINGDIYYGTLSSLPTAEAIKSGLTIEAKKNGGSLAYFRCYGAKVVVEYIEP